MTRTEAAAAHAAASASSPALFTGGGLVARELLRREIPALQAFFDANPEYNLVVNGRPPPPDAAAVDFDERPPPHLSFTSHPVLGLFERPAEASSLAGVVIVATDLCLAGVWHLGLFIVATRLHGRGVAQGVYDAYEGWARAGGARWLRLSVAVGNLRAERFWQRQGYVELRRREGIDTGGRINTMRVMLKPLAAEGIEAYLDAVPRDRPGSTLP